MRALSETSVQYVKGVGPAKKKVFERLGVLTIEDLLYFFPRRHEDRRVLTKIAQTQVGQTHTITGRVKVLGARRSWHTKKHLLEVQVDDGSGRIICTWFNQPFLKNYFEREVKAVFHGKVGVYKNKLQMISPEYEIINSDDEQFSLGRIVPIYPLTRGITQRYLRKIIFACLERHEDDLIDELPVSLRNKHRLSNIKRSLRHIHFPDNFEEQEEAMRRVSFEEFFFYQLSIVLRRVNIILKQGVAHNISDAFALKFINAFPFELTRAQKKVIREIRNDMNQASPMLRLLQGDVGSGKTIVALFGCLAAIERGYQSAIMAPTEILARQHYEKVMVFLKGLKGCGDKGLKEDDGDALKANIALLTSSTPKKERERIIGEIASGKVGLVIGTHALITDDVEFKNLSFIVIDEQHKFGVRQRALLSEKGQNPDVLIMTATPIPRTLCLTLYGDLDVSVIDEMPPGRGTIKTLSYAQGQADQAYALIRAELKKGRQAYVVYPIIEESEKSDLKAARDMYTAFTNKDFKDFRVGLVHGRLTKKETETIMQGFREKDIDLLVATTVVEVGLDIPNASIMVIEHAERFGLAQLHQLRGRIGRGKEDSLCVLVADAQNEEAQARMSAMLSTTDGFEIARQDLMIRGPGRFFGRHQHGLNELKVANPATQLDILELAREEALTITKNDPRLEQSEHQALARVIKNRYPTYLANLKAG